jgi:hypothetical protein
MAVPLRRWPFMLVAYAYGDEPTVPDMGIAAGLGAAIGGALMLIYERHFDAAGGWALCQADRLAKRGNRDEIMAGARNGYSRGAALTVLAFSSWPHNS